MNLQRMVRVGDWKLIHYPKAQVYRLYDLATDPWEERDLAADPTQAARLTDLKQKLAASEKVFDDPLAAQAGAQP